jgi:hypothetical protein
MEALNHQHVPALNAKVFIQFAVDAPEKVTNKQGQRLTQAFAKQLSQLACFSTLNLVDLR